MIHCEFEMKREKVLLHRLRLRTRESTIIDFIDIFKERNRTENSPNQVILLLFARFRINRVRK